MRLVEYTDKKVIEVLDEKYRISEENIKLLKEMEELETKIKDNHAKMTRLDEKSRVKIKKELKNMALGEYEELSRVYREKDGQWFFEIADRMEEFKAAWNKK